MQTFELTEFLDSHLAEYKQYARQKNVGLTIITDFVSSITLKGNETKIKFLLGSILKSTIDHSEATDINFSIRQLLRSGKEVLLEFSVEDNGCVSRSAKKFSYFRSLAIARSVIEELNGKSELILSPEQGTVLKFVIRCSLKSNSESISSPGNFSFLKEKKVLIVDDNESNQKTIVRFLSNEGVECTTAPDGIKAIELLEQNNVYDLILLDISMPRMDGFETAGYIRKKLNNTTPIIAIPAKDTDGMSSMCRDAGIDALLKKPFSAESLLNSVNSALAPVLHRTTLPLMKSA
jgi:CheY-like chemotaxis protein